jgi:uncharacterized protein
VVAAEPGAEQALEFWNQADGVICLTVGYLEVRSAIARRFRGRTAARARALLDEQWLGVETLGVDDQLVALAVRVADAHRLRTFDALHLAAALDSGRPELLLLSWDEELRQAAEAEGLAVAP